MKKHSILRKAIYIFIWLLLWQAASLMIHNEILLVGPLSAGRELLRLSANPIFTKSVLFSLLRIAGGIFLGSLLGLSASFASWRSHLVRDFLAPFVTMIKAVPVAAFVILLLIWFGSDNIALVISLLVTFPILYINSLQALDALDPQMQEMAAAFRLPRFSRLRYILLPESLPALLSAFSLAIGMGIKSGVAAEVIGQTSLSLGNALYRSKIYLETGQLLAWTAVIILLSWLLEKGWIALLRAIILPKQRKMHASPFPSFDPPSRKIPSGAVNLYPLCLDHIRIGYEDLTILEDFSYSFLPGRTYVLTGPSGSGKTSLLMAILKKAGHAGIVFQENRLVLDFSAEDNLRLLDPARISRPAAARLLAPLFDCEDFHPEIPVCDFSGGMQRRVAIARACISAAPVLLFDEPLTGLDQKNAQKALHYISNMRSGRAVIFTAHRANLLREYFPDLVEIALPAHEAIP